MKLKSDMAEDRHDFISKRLLYGIFNRSGYPVHQQRLRSLLWIGCFGLSLILSTAAGAQAGNFQAIEQPLVVKLGVTTLGSGLIVLELWWFLAKRK